MIVIEAWALYGRTSLKSINLPEGLLEIKEKAFSVCTQLENLILPSTLQKIGARAFCDCKNIKTLIIPASVEKIENDAFWQCYGLEEVTVLNPDIELAKTNLKCNLIRGYIGSTAASYAAQAQISFKPLD